MLLNAKGKKKAKEVFYASKKKGKLKATILMLALVSICFTKGYNEFRNI